MFEFIIALPFGKVLHETQLPSQLKHDWKKCKHLKTETLLYLQHLVLKKCWYCKKQPQFWKKSRILILDTIYEKSQNLLKFGWVTNEL